MLLLDDKKVLVIGLDPRGVAAAEFLARSGSVVFVFDDGSRSGINHARKFETPGIKTVSDLTDTLRKGLDFAVTTPSTTPDSPILSTLRARGVPVMSELELGFQHLRCLVIAIAGTNGKGTTAELIQTILEANHRRAVVTGDQAHPICSVVERSRDLDYVLVKVNAFQLQVADSFRPAVGVLLNSAPEHGGRFGTSQDYIRVLGHVFKHQQSFDWAVVQTGALSRLASLNVPIPAKIITFSAEDNQAELRLDRSLIISRIEQWSGPLLNFEECCLRGRHNAENIMAALAVGRILRLPLNSMVDAIKRFQPRQHCFEKVGESGGVEFINDSKARNLNALRGALLSARTGQSSKPNVLLIAGGRPGDTDYHDVGPLVSRATKHVYLIGEAAQKIRAAWSLFTPCSMADSLLEAVIAAAKNAASGDVVLLSPACSSFDQFKDYQHRGESFCSAVNSICSGVRA